MRKSVLKSLQSIIQGEVFFQKELREFYSVDASSYQIIPKVVVIPKNERDQLSLNSLFYMVAMGGLEPPTPAL